MTLTGTGFMWWEHFTTNTPGITSTNNVYRLVFDIGRSTGYISEAKHILNGQRDASWDAGFYLPVALNQKGTIVYWDYKLEDHTGTVPAGGSLGQIGSPFVKAPSLQPGDNTLVAYRLTLGSLPTPDTSEKATTTLSIKSAELDATGNAKTDLISHLDKSIADTATDIKSNVNAMINSAMSAINTHVDAQVSSAMSMINGHVDGQVSSATSAINTHLDGQVSSAMSAVNSHTDAQISSAISSVNGHADTATSSVNSHTDSQVASLSSSVSSLPQSSITYVIATLAAIAAIAAVASTLIVSRRLKVAG
jgi:hypothetical protein